MSICPMVMLENVFMFTFHEKKLIAYNAAFFSFSINAFEIVVGYLELSYTL